MPVEKGGRYVLNEDGVRNRTEYTKEPGENGHKPPVAVVNEQEPHLENTESNDDAAQ